MSRTHSVVMLFALLCALVSGRADAVQRAHVATYGLDSNTSFNCSVANPCRFFQAATTVVDPNGEVVVLDSGGYGGVTITKSLALVAPTGVYAGITVFPGANGVTIATPGVSVVLRGLTINGQGGDNGIVMTAGASLSIENCVIANFPGVNPMSVYSGIVVNTAAKVRIIDTLLRDNLNGINLQDGAIATISRVTVVGSGNSGIRVVGITAGTTTTAAISDTTVSGSGVAGIYAISFTATAGVRASVIRSTATNGNVGIRSESAVLTAPALLTVSESMVTGNTTGLLQSGVGATLRSLGNNTLEQNGTPTIGTITAATLL